MPEKENICTCPQAGKTYIATLGIMRDKLRAPIESLNAIVEFQGAPQLGPHDAERRQSLGQLHV